MDRKHYVIIGPGMDGRVAGLQFLTRDWQTKYGLTPVVVPITWKDNEHFARKLARIIDLIDKYAKNKDIVSLIGCSASGSAMLNAFVERKDVVYKVVNNGGFLRPGKAKGFRSFKRRSTASMAFRESVLRFAQLESTLSAQDKKKILTVRPLFGDELVPPDTVVIQGALNATVPVGEHILSIVTALLLYRPVIVFLKENI